MRAPWMGWCVGLAVLVAAVSARGQSVPPPAEPATQGPLFAVEIRIGPRWDAAKPAHEQAFFREHSANLRKLREAGQLAVGARYGDKGLVILSAATADAARVLMDADPAIAHGTFVYEVHEFRVFYPGTVQARTAPR